MHLTQRPGWYTSIGLCGYVCMHDRQSLDPPPLLLLFLLFLLCLWSLQLRLCEPALPNLPSPLLSCPAIFFSIFKNNFNDYFQSVGTLYNHCINSTSHGFVVVGVITLASCPPCAAFAVRDWMGLPAGTAYMTKPAIPTKLAVSLKFIKFQADLAHFLLVWRSWYPGPLCSSSGAVLRYMIHRLAIPAPVLGPQILAKETKG